MGSFILRGITTALLVTVLTLFAGIVWGVMGLGGLSVSRLLDIGLLASCLIGGYRTAKESGVWWLGGAAGAGYVTVGTLLLALFLPIQGWGFIKILAEGVIIGLVAGALGVGNGKATSGVWQRNRSYSPSYVDYGSDEGYSNKFDWDTEEKYQEKRSEPIKFQWVNNEEGESKGVHAVKQDSEESSEVVWPWDREGNINLISSGSGYSELPIVREADPVWTDSFRGNRVSTDNLKVNMVRETRPWWEE